MTPAAVEIAQYAGLKLSRGDYQQLVKAGLCTAAAVEPPPFTDVTRLLESFLMPPAQAMASDDPWDRTWKPIAWT